MSLAPADLEPTSTLGASVRTQAPEVTFCQPGDEEELSAFDRRRDGPPSSPEYWRWKYFDNPAGEACVAVARVGGEIVGRVGFLPVRMRVGGSEVVASQQVDVAIMPEYRGGGIYFQLAYAVMEEAARRGVAFGFGFATEDTRALSVDILGFDLVGPVNRLARVLDYGHYAGVVLGRPAAQVVGAVADLVRRRWPRPSSTRPRDVCRVDRFDAQFETLAASPVPDPYMAIRDAVYLNWRYVDCPTVDYKAYAIKSDGAIRGFVVAHAHEADGIVRGIIDEIVCPGDDRRTVERLLAPALADLAAEGAVNVICWLPAWHPLRPSLRSLGFRGRKARNYLIVIQNRTAGVSVRHLEEERRWYYTHGDSDFKMRSA